MKKLLDTTEHLYLPAQADALAAQLQADEDEDGWTYRAVHDPQGAGRSYVAAYEADGTLIAKF